MVVASYDAQDRLTKYKDNSYQYNALGQLTQKTTPSGTDSFNYDVFGNLRGVSLANGDSIEYLIDPKNRRIGKKKNGQITQKLLYQDQLNPLAELYADNSVKNLFIYAEKRNVPSAMERYDESGNLTGKYRIISNHLGSVVMVVNAETGTIEQEIKYDVWGNVLSDTVPNFQPFYFAGGLYDTDTKLTRFGARDYDAETGRWTAKDPIGFSGGLTSLYDYVGGDPVNYVDSDGLQSTSMNGYDSWHDPEYIDPFEAIDHLSIVISVCTLNSSTGALFSQAARTLFKRGGSDKLVTVTRWGREGLENGDWVIKGENNLKNYLLSGKYQKGFGNRYASKSSGESYQVPKSSLKFPEKEGGKLNPLNFIKYTFGQRQYIKK